MQTHVHLYPAFPGGRCGLGGACGFGFQVGSVRSECVLQENQDSFVSMCLEDRVKVKLQRPPGMDSSSGLHLLSLDKPCSSENSRSPQDLFTRLMEKYRSASWPPVWWYDSAVLNPVWGTRFVKISGA